VPDLQRNIDLIKDAKALGQLIGIFRRNRFDIVHTHTAKAGALGRFAARCAGVNSIIHTPHGHTFYGYFGSWMSGFCVFAERLLARITDMTVVLTDIEKNDMLQYRITTLDRMRLIAQGVELEPFMAPQAEAAQRFRRSLHVTDGQRLVGMIARIEPVKGPDIFVAAARIVSERMPSVIFVVVGEGSLRQRLMERSRQYGLSQKIIFTGWREDVAQIAQAFELLALPSRNEAAGMILIEAQAAGVPVVATHVGGIPEIVCDGKTGILVSPEDPHALAAALEDLLLDEAKRRMMSHEAKKWVSERFEAKRMCAETEVLYKELYAAAQKKGCAARKQ